LPPPHSIHYLLNLGGPGDLNFQPIDFVTARRMPQLKFGILLSLGIQSLLVGPVSAVTCYGVNGLGYQDNIICPGSNACCNRLEGCQPNRLCHNEGQNNSTFVRGPCALKPYNSASCAEICLYSMFVLATKNLWKVMHSSNSQMTDETTGFLPRVTVCADGSYCCDAIPNCCESDQGVFLDAVGAITTGPLSSSSTTLPALSSKTTTESSSSSITANIVTPATSPGANSSQLSAAQSISPSSSRSGLSTGAKIGMGIGIPLILIILGGLVAMICIQRRRLKLAKVSERNTSLNVAGNYGPGSNPRKPLPVYAEVHADTPAKELPAEPRMAELPAH